uniref:BURP domain-containing protein n=1 Tax=Zea mays TaxID=4577 RepID=A0A804LV81_MAIZE
MHTRATRYWRRGAMPGMDAFAAVSLLATLFLVRAAAAHPPAAAADAMTPTDYWRAVLPETPMPRAILDLLTTSTVGEGSRKVTTSYPYRGQDLRMVSTSYVSQDEDNSWKATMSYGFQSGEGSRKVTTSYPYRGQDLRMVSTSYVSQDEDNSWKVSMPSRFQVGEGSRKLTTPFESQREDSRKATASYGIQDDEDTRKATTSYGIHGEDPRKATTSYGIQDKEYPRKATTSYGVQGDIHHHDHAAVHIHSSGNKLVADVFFFHDVLRPGSVITPIIPPTITLPPLLPLREADALPFSTGRFADILAMFAPTTSDAMGEEIRSTLDTCENTRPLPGEKAACATSLESLARIPAVLLGTRNVRAFSGDMPTDPAGTSAKRGRYNVTAVQKLSESLTAAACHDLTYPYVVFYCHTTNPAATYLVKLAAQDGGTPDMEALVVCHLDTSLWSPRHPFLVAHSLKPGDDAVVCHFLSKLSIVWVPAGEQGWRA